MVEYVCTIIAVTTSRNAVPARRRCLNTALRRSSRWMGDVPLTVGSETEAVVSDGIAAARISSVSNIGRGYFWGLTGRFASGRIAVMPVAAAADETAIAAFA